jgi:hypothetical protein
VRIPSLVTLLSRDSEGSAVGGPTSSHDDIPAHCDGNVSPCLLDETGRVTFDWQWPSRQRITLSTTVGDSQKPLVTIAYDVAAEKASSKTPGL